MVMVLLDYLVGIPSPKLNVPDTFEVTHTHVRAHTVVFTENGIGRSLIWAAAHVFGVGVEEQQQCRVVSSLLLVLMHQGLV